MYVSGYWTTYRAGGGTAEARGIVPLLSDCGDHSRMVIIQYFKMDHYTVKEPWKPRKFKKPDNQRNILTRCRDSRANAHPDPKCASHMLIRLALTQSFV